LKLKANRLGNAHYHWQSVAQPWRLIPVTRSSNKRRDDVAIAVAEGHDLVAFDLLVPAKSDVVAAFLRCCRRAVAMDDRGVEELGLMKLQYRPREDRFETAIRLPPAKRAIDPRAPSSCRLLDQGAMDCSTVGDRRDHAAMATPVTSAQVANA
jgi:hypothetical protein